MGGIKQMRAAQCSQALFPELLPQREQIPSTSFIAMVSVPSSHIPTHIEYGALILEGGDGRRVAVGRAHLERMTPAAARTYLLSWSPGGCDKGRIEGAFRLRQGGPLEWIEVDLGGWGELLRYMHRIRVVA
ncbi:hypothetical protein BD626DRAFT_479368 [Schizophyllum amplum]|uniref:Uncharacterized protein n=1 Tax=Schizophyllum amplum TaxID=97359 RepID=A0A550CS67_9AGAR|nr:hypothetical protein BD626DRAFT_479368 [Auriculariopsis ampla]